MQVNFNPRKLLQTAEFQYRNLFLQRPLVNFNPSTNWERLTPEEGKQKVDDLKNEGVAFFPKFLDKNEVNEIREVLDVAVKKKSKNHQYVFSEKSQNHNIFQTLVTKAAIRAALSPDIRRIAEIYYKRPVRMTESDMRRTPAMSMEEPIVENEKFQAGLSSSHWHHDTRGKMLKIQIYLTDTINPDGQNFVYIRGTRPIFHTNNLKSSRFSDEWVEKNFDSSKIVECYGKAGDGILFDANCIHRLRRKPTSARDTITFYYTPGFIRSIGHYVNKKHYDELADNDRNYLNIIGTKAI